MPPKRANKATAEPEPYLAKATRLFNLHNPVVSTEQQWKKYGANRAAAEEMCFTDGEEDEGEHYNSFPAGKDGQ